MTERIKNELAVFDEVIGVTRRAIRRKGEVAERDRPWNIQHLERLTATRKEAVEMADSGNVDGARQLLQRCYR